MLKLMLDPFLLLCYFVVVVVVVVVVGFVVVVVVLLLLLPLSLHAILIFMDRNCWCLNTLREEP